MANDIFLRESDFRKIFKDHLRIQASQKPIANLFGPRMRSKIDYSPYYQRHYVWDKPKAAYFIESIDHLRIQASQKPIANLFGPRMRSKIDYSPYYQRHYVWDKPKAAYFIESILLGTAIPPLVFFHSNSKIEVVVGTQTEETTT